MAGVGRFALAFENFRREVEHIMATQVGLQRVSTPTLVRCPGLEPQLAPFRVHEDRGPRSLRERESLEKPDFFLPTSPELQLKRLLAQGLPSLFELRPCFRSGDDSTVHSREFWLLEWYRVAGTLKSLQSDVLALLSCLQKQGWHLPGRVFATASSATQAPIPEITVRELFAQVLNVDLQPDAGVEQMRAWAQQVGYVGDSQDSLADLFHAVFVAAIEPELRQRDWVWVTEWPRCVAALSRILDTGWSERLELYFCGLELANGYGELTSLHEQKARDVEFLNERRRVGSIEPPVDHQFYQALESGIPPCSGMALGVERLFMSLTGAQDIQELKWLPERSRR